MLYNWLENIEFARMWVLWGLLILPLLIFLYSFTRKKRKSALLVTSARAFTTKTGKNAFLNLPFILRLLTIACVIVALAQPRLKHVQNRYKGQGIDIILCLDVSGSMGNPDIPPNRLEVAKKMAIDFVKSRPVDQIGLVIFGGESYTQYPLSTEHTTLISHLDGLRPGMLADGTLIGEGLATAADRLSRSKAKSKVIILLTDGKEEAPETRLIDPKTALEIAKSRGVKVYTIGMGGRTGFVYTETGKQEVSGDQFLDAPLLKTIAAQTGGAYFRATDQASLEEIYQRIDRMEKSNVEVIEKARYDELFFWFVLAALFFLLLEILLRYTTFRTFP
jgi:Ca-activated chloride channel family protein